MSLYNILFYFLLAVQEHPNFSHLTQCTYYWIRLLTEPQFRMLGRLTCEYIVDEEARLNYIHRGRQQQTQQQSRF